MQTKAEAGQSDAERCGQQLNVYFPDTEYFLTAVDSGKCDCLPEPVRKCKSHGNRRPGDSSYGSEYRSCYCILQNHGSGKEGMRSLDLKVC